MQRGEPVLPLDGMSSSDLGVKVCPFASFPDHREISGSIISAILKLAKLHHSLDLIWKSLDDPEMKTKDRP